MAKSPVRMVTLGARVSPSVAERVVARAKAERRLVSHLVAIWIEDGLDRPVTVPAPSPESTPNLTDLTAAEAEYLTVLDKALAAGGIDLNDGRRVVSHAAFRKAYAEVRGGGPYVHLGSPRKLLEARKVVGSDQTRLWRIR